MPDPDDLTAFIHRMVEADQRLREAMDRLRRHQAATASLRQFPHPFTSMDGPDAAKIRSDK